jgi:hypothetical protein
MTPADEARFIALWQAGTETAEISRQLGIPRGTVASRAHTLAKQGKIQPRPKGGSYPRQKAQGRQEEPPAPPAPQVAPATPTAPAMTFVAVPEIQELLSLVKDLHARVGALEQAWVPPALPAPRYPPRPPRPRVRRSNSGRSGCRKP